MLTASSTTESSLITNHPGQKKTLARGDAEIAHLGYHDRRVGHLNNRQSLSQEETEQGDGTIQSDAGEPDEIERVGPGLAFRSSWCRHGGLS